MSLKIQMRERAKRKRNRLNARGMRTPPGTSPRKHEPSGEPIFKPMKLIGDFDVAHFLAGINLLLTPWWRRRYKKDSDNRPTP